MSNRRAQNVLKDYLGYVRLSQEEREFLEDRGWMLSTNIHGAEIAWSPQGWYFTHARWEYEQLAKSELPPRGGPGHPDMRHALTTNLWYPS